MKVFMDEEMSIDDVKPRLMTFTEQRKAADELIQELKDTNRITSWEAKVFSRRWVR